MATLTNNLASGKNFRLNEVFAQRPMDVGFAYYRNNNPDSPNTGMRLDFHSPENEEKGRNYSLTLSPLDVGKIVNRLLNPNYNIGFFSSMSPDPSNRSDYHYEELLLEHGIKPTTWRYPAPSFANGTERWFWVRAVNRYHAEHQFASLIKSFNPALLEEYQEEDSDND